MPIATLPPPPAGALKTEAEILATPPHELAGAALACAEPSCRCGPDPASLRVVMQELWFTCRGGHLNALGLSAWQEAA